MLVYIVPLWRICRLPARIRGTVDTVCHREYDTAFIFLFALMLCFEYVLSVFFDRPS